MTGKILLIDHPIGQRDDRASRRLAERGYRIEWCCPGRGDPLPANRAGYVGAVAYGGAEDLSVDEERPYLKAEIEWIGGWVAEGRPFLGICLGGQLLARALGAEVAPHPEGLHQIGYYEIAPTVGADGFLNGRLHVYHWHKEGFAVPRGAELLATGPDFPNQAFRFGRRAYGLQFHPEVSPEVIERWIGDSETALSAPGAQSKSRQRSGAQAHDAAMAAWFEGFLDRWLDGC